MDTSKILKESQKNIMKQAILLIDLIQLIHFANAIKEFMQAKNQPQEFQIYWSIFVILAFILLTLLVHANKVKSDQVTVLCCFIFTL
jgi:hypothetical protein